MKKRTRKTDFWSVPTPSKVGPGSYDISQKPKLRHNSAPFSKSELKQSTYKIIPSDFPGPGSYMNNLNWVKNSSPSSSFVSALPRTGPIPIGRSQDCSPSFDTPGPGAYDIDIKSFPKTERKRRGNSMIVGPTIASIPYKPGQDVILGPASYNPDVSLVKPSVISTSFADYLSKRDMFNIKQNRNVGPGKYIISEGKTSSKQSWVFRSKVSKDPNLLKADSQPGPGSYDPRQYIHQPRVLVEGFGSTTERDILLTNDPHRPYANSDYLLQPIFENQPYQSSKQDYYRQKYLYPKTPIPKPAFGSSVKRESPWANLNTITGPGDYQLSTSESNHAKFVTKSPRFKMAKGEEQPGPGAYDSPITDKNPVYLSKAPRFAEPKSQVPENYLGHEDWSAKAAKVAKAQLMNYAENGIRFGSSSPRFIEANSESPGPGHYVVKEKKPGPSVIHSTGNRFSQHGSYIKHPITETDIGPGSYHKEPKLGKKTFNISPDIGNDRPWI